MPDISPTDSTEDNTGADNTALPEDHSDDSADSKANTDSSDNSQDSDDSADDNSSSTGDKGSSDEDKAFARFAKSQGIEDVSELSEREARLLRVAHDNQKAARNKGKDSTEEITTAAADAFSVDDDDIADDDPAVAENKIIRAEMAQMRAEKRIDKFFQDNSEAQEYQEDMRDILVRTIEEDGKDAARYLTKNLKHLLAIAKEERGDGNDAAREEGRRAEREELRRKGESSAGTGHAASQSTSSRSTKIDKNWVDNTYDPSNEEHRQMLDAALARGDLY